MRRGRCSRRAGTRRAMGLPWGAPGRLRSRARQQAYHSSGLLVPSRKLTRRDAPDKRGCYDAFFLCDDDLDATTLCEPLFALALLAEAFDFARALEALWCAFRRDRVCSRRFQPFLASERNDAGIAMVCEGSSVTATAAASVRSARTSAITLAGWRARAACTRLVSRITNISRSGSIQRDVPV